MDQPIAVRILPRRDGKPLAVRLELYPPRQDADGDWSCRLRVLEGDRLVAEDEGTGGDSLEAITSGMAGLRWHFHRNNLTGHYFEDEENTTGIPRFLPQGYGPEFDERLTRILDEAINEYGEELKKKRGGSP